MSPTIPPCTRASPRKASACMPRRTARPTSTRSCIADDSSGQRDVSVPQADVEAIVQGAGRGVRLGLGPKAFIVLAGRTLLERAVSTMLAVAARVTVAVSAADLDR